MNTREEQIIPKSARNWTEIEDAIVVEEVHMPVAQANVRALDRIDYTQKAIKATATIGKEVAVFAIFTVAPFVLIGVIKIAKATWSIFWVAMEILFGFLYSVAIDINNKKETSNGIEKSNETTGNWKRNTTTNNATGNGNNIIINVNVNSK